VKGECKRIGLYLSNSLPSFNCLELTMLVLRGMKDPNLTVLMKGLRSWSDKR